MQPDQLIVPEIDAQELKEFVETLLPQSQVTFSPMNPDYGSWQIEVIAEGIRAEYFWGPLSAFGFTNLYEQLKADDNPFDPYGVNLQSAEVAQNCLRHLIARSA